MLKTWVEAIVDIFRTSPKQHWQMLKQDSFYALRVMVKNLGFTTIAVITLALGVGVNTAIFSVVRGVILRPLPYDHGDEIMILREQLQKTGVADTLFSVPEIRDYHEQSSTLKSVVEYHRMRFTLLGHGMAERVRTGVVSANYFDFFGIKPILGRSFLPSEEQPGAPPSLLLSYEFWQGAQHGDPDIVGKTFAMNDKPHTVIGVLPPVPQYPRENDVYMTTSSCPFRSDPDFAAGRDNRMMSVFARRKADVTPLQVNTDLRLISNRLQQQYPEFYPRDAGYRTAAFPLREELTNGARPTLWVLLLVAAFVLLIACANVANLTLARLAQREQEFALRSALGATRTRLFRQLFTESVLLGLVAGGLGLVFAILSHKLLVQFVARLTPRAHEITIDGWVLLFAVGVAFLTSVVTGCSQAFFSNDMEAGLKDSTRGSTAGTRRKRVRDLLIVAQVGFSFALLIGAGLMLRSFVKLQNVDPGFSGERVLTMAIDLNWSKYVTDAQDRAADHAILEKVQALPGVSSVAISSSFPLDPDAIDIGIGVFGRNIEVEGKPLQKGDVAPMATFRTASGDYFKTLGIPLIQGRTFLPTDLEKAPAVVMVNQAFARHRFPGVNPIGRRISRNGGGEWASIVGIVGNTREFDVSLDPADEVYYPTEQHPGLGSLLVRTNTDPMAMADQVRRAVHSFDSGVVVTNLETLEAARQDTLSSPRVMTSLLGIFAVLALVVAAAGIGGMLALSVSQRTKEIGVRVALGAQRSQVLAMVIMQGMVLVLVGLVFGLVVALGMTRSLKAFLFQVVLFDPVTLGGVGVLLAIVAFVACYIPARRATKISPLVALRHE
jgi:putative ABC transport system permease protein